MEHRKPKAVSRKLDPEKQAAFIRAYEDLLNHLDADEAVLFGDAVHPTHAVRPVGCWAPKDTPIAVAQTSGRQRLNIHGAIDLETGQTRMLEVETVDAASTIMLMMATAGDVSAQAGDPSVSGQRPLPSREAGAGLAGATRLPDQASLHPDVLPASGPDRTAMGLDAQARHPQRVPRDIRDFSDAILTFLREEVPRNWHLYCDDVTDNFRIISPKDFRILA